MCDGHCRCCCCKNRIGEQDGASIFFVLLLPMVGVVVYLGYRFGLVVADLLSPLLSLVIEHQTELLYASFAAILIDLAIMTRRVAHHVARLPLANLSQSGLERCLLTSQRILTPLIAAISERRRSIAAIRGSLPEGAERVRVLTADSTAPRYLAQDHRGLPLGRRPRVPASG